jgi:hypothetical protein
MQEPRPGRAKNFGEALLRPTPLRSGLSAAQCRGSPPGLGYKWPVSTTLRIFRAEAAAQWQDAVAAA